MASTIAILVTTIGQKSQQSLIFYSTCFPTSRFARPCRDQKGERTSQATRTSPTQSFLLFLLYQQGKNLMLPKPRQTISPRHQTPASLSQTAFHPL